MIVLMVGTVSGTPTPTATPNTPVDGSSNDSSLATTQTTSTPENSQNSPDNTPNQDSEEDGVNLNLNIGGGTDEPEQETIIAQPGPNTYILDKKYDTDSETVVLTIRTTTANRYTIADSMSGFAKSNNGGFVDTQRVSVASGTHRVELPATEFNGVTAISIDTAYSDRPYGLPVQVEKQDEDSGLFGGPYSRSDMATGIIFGFASSFLYILRQVYKWWKDAQRLVVEV